MSEPVEGDDVSLASRAVSATIRLRELWTGASDRMQSAGEHVHDAVEKPVRGFYGALHRSPGAVIIILLLGTGFIGQYAVDFQHQINGDVEIYLPDGAESKDLLLEVREGWSTDIVMLYIHTANAIEDEGRRGTCDEADDCEYNVTSVNVLKQLSYLEGDDVSGQGNYARGLDWDKEDRGRNDGVVWILSPSQVIKEANSSRARFTCAMEEHGIVGFNLDRALVILDSDGQHDASDIPNLLEPILAGDADVVIGSRFVDGGGAESMPTYRALGIKVITAASNLSSDLKVKDTQSGFRAFGPRALERLNFDHDGMESCLEILNACNDMQLKVDEVPTKIRYDVPKGSRYTALSHGFTVLSFALISLSQKKPLLFFGLPGISLLATGAAIGMRALNEVEVLTDGSISLTVGPGLTAAWIGMLGASLCFAALVLHGARRLMRRLMIQEFGLD